MCGGNLKCLVIVLGTLNIVSTGKIEPNCNCIPLKNCTSMLRLTENLQEPMKTTFFEFLSSKQCGTDNGSPKVCCTDSLKKDLAEVTIPTPSSSCGTKSDCVNLNSCDPYMNLIKTSAKPLQASVVHFLRNQECGFENDMPKVCCSPVPINIQALKHSRSESRRPINKLSVDSAEDHTTMLPSTRRTFFASGRSTTAKKMTGKKDSQAFEAFRDGFLSDFFDYGGTFDLMNRKKRFDIDSYTDVEIK
ncbi:hypothetical protein JTB14_016947 [Gonioctena quinquepunctata]|nr:hypothetical protein JTB14_016947 [Gonioctena quinquepunctata]